MYFAYEVITFAQLLAKSVRFPKTTAKLTYDEMQRIWALDIPEKGQFERLFVNAYQLLPPVALSDYFEDFSSTEEEMINNACDFMSDNFTRWFRAGSKCIKIVKIRSMKRLFHLVGEFRRCCLTSRIL